MKCKIFILRFKYKLAYYIFYFSPFSSKGGSMKEKLQGKSKFLLIFLGIDQTKNCSRDHENR